MALQRAFVRRNRIETLLLKEKVENNQIVECPTDEWIALWEEYAKEDRIERNLWDAEELVIVSNPINILSNSINKVLQNLQFLKKKDKELFTEIFEEHFIANLIWNFSRKRVFFYINKPKEFEVMFIDFVKKNLIKGALEDVLWKRILNDMSSESPFSGTIDMVDVVSSINTWKACFQKEVYVDLNNFKKVIMRCWPIADEMERLKEDFMPFLNVVDEFKNSKTFFLYGSNTRHLKEFVEYADEEMMLMALKKNFIGKDMIQKAMNLAITQNKLELMSLFILKKFDEGHNEDKEGNEDC